MKKVIFPVIISMLFLSCSREEWNEDRRVRFTLFQDISFNGLDGHNSEINCSILYNIVGDTDTVNLKSFNKTYQAQSYQTWHDENQFQSYNHDLKNYDYLEFKLRISCTANPLSSKYTLIAMSEMPLPNIYRSQTDTLTSFNNSDTTIYFIWSPPNFN